MHLGHSLSSCERTEIVQSAKRSLWSSFNIFLADFGHISPPLKNVCYYGSRLWPLEGAMLQSLCVDWKKAMRWVWSVNNITHCDNITSLSNQVPLFFSLKNRFIEFIRNCLSCQNNIVHMISKVAICNLMSNTGSKYICT